MSASTDYLGISLTVFIVVALILIVWSRVTGQSVGEILADIKGFFTGGSD